MYKYAAWADRMIGHWRVAEDGHQSPNVSADGGRVGALLRGCGCRRGLCMSAQDLLRIPHLPPLRSLARASLRSQVRCLVKPLLGMFANEPKGKKWRAAVSEAARQLRPTLCLALLCAAP